MAFDDAKPYPPEVRLRARIPARGARVFANRRQSVAAGAHGGSGGLRTRQTLRVCAEELTSFAPQLIDVEG